MYIEIFPLPIYESYSFRKKVSDEKKRLQTSMIQKPAFNNRDMRSWNVRSYSRKRRCQDLESGVYRSWAWEFGEITWDNNDVGLVGDALVPVLLRDEHHPVLGDCHRISHQRQSMLESGQCLVWSEANLLPTEESGLWGRLARPSTALCLPLPGGQTWFQTQLFRPQS